MYKRLYNFLEQQNVLYSLQFGFRASHSINHALISMKESIKERLDNRKYGCGIFIDLQKAFDTVNHEILFGKLEHCGIRGPALTGLDPILLIENKMSLFMVFVLIYLASHVGYHKALSLVLCYSLSS